MDDTLRLLFLRLPANYARSGPIADETAREIEPGLPLLFCFALSAESWNNGSSDRICRRSLINFRVDGFWRYGYCRPGFLEIFCWRFGGTPCGCRYSWGYEYSDFIFYVVYCVDGWLGGMRVLTEFLEDGIWAGIDCTRILWLEIVIGTIVISFCWTLVEWTLIVL